MKTKVVSFDDFEVSLDYFQDTAVVIIHNKIPGIGTIITTEVNDGIIDTDKLLGVESELLNILALNLSKVINAPRVVFTFSFHPSIFPDNDSIRSFILRFKNILDVE